MSARVTCSCGWTRSYQTRERAEFNARRHVCAAGKPRVRKARRSYRCARCGYEATYENAGAAEARYWFSRHSCQKEEIRNLSRWLRTQRDAAVDREPKPCLHKIANHQHGTPACYVLDKCRCTPCSVARAAAESTRERQKAYGRYHKYVAAQPVRDHIEALREAGMGYKRVGEIAGVSHGALWKLLYGKRQPDGSYRPSVRVLRTTADKIYAVDPLWSGQPLPLADGAFATEVDAERAVLRLRSLVALGYSCTKVGDALGAGGTNVIPILMGARRLRVFTVKRADSLFEAWAMRLPAEETHHQRVAASRARNFAKRHGWVPPLALPDMDVDDVEPGPTGDDFVDEAVVERIITERVRPRKPTHAEAAEVVRRLRARGVPDSRIEKVWGIKVGRYKKGAAS